MSLRKACANHLNGGGWIKFTMTMKLGMLREETERANSAARYAGRIFPR